MMSEKTKAQLFDLPKLRNRVHVFKDRQEAGEVPASMLERYGDSDALVLAIPAGGVAVGGVIGQKC